METSAATYDHPLEDASQAALSAGTAIAVACAAAVTAGLALRFGDLGMQSYHHDEVITAARILPGSLGHVLHEVRVSESCPPLYYVLAHWWGGLFGFHEAGLRSLSAVFGALTIPAAYFAGKELLDRRAGMLTAAFVALNPMLIWYSQEARSYSLLVLMTTVSLVFFLRALHHGRAVDILLWGAAGVLALGTHYFAAGVIAIEAVWLLIALGPNLALLASYAMFALLGAALLPLALDQMNPHHIGWISAAALPLRITQTGASFAIGETGRVIGQRPRDGIALPFGVLAAAALALGMLTKRGAIEVGKPLVIGFGSMALAILAALAGHDYVLARNLLPALVPICLAVGVALVASPRRWLAATIAVAICAGSLAFNIHAASSPDLQRPDWRQLAQGLGPARDGRALVSWKLGAVPLRYYLGSGDWVHSGDAMLREVDLVGRPAVEHRMPRIPGFTPSDIVKVGRLEGIRYTAPEPRLVNYSRLETLPTGFGKNAVILQDTPKLPRTFGRVRAP